MNLIKFKRPRNQRVKKLRGYQKRFNKIITYLISHSGYYHLLDCYNESKSDGDLNNLRVLMRLMTDKVNNLLVLRSTLGSNIRIKFSHYNRFDEYGLKVDILTPEFPNGLIYVCDTRYSIELIPINNNGRILVGKKSKFRNNKLM